MTTKRERERERAQCGWHFQFLFLVHSFLFELRIDRVKHTHTHLPSGRMPHAVISYGDGKGRSTQGQVYSMSGNQCIKTEFKTPCRNSAHT